MKRALTLCLLLFGMIAQANHGLNDRVLELKKKAIYYEIQAQLAAEEITLKEAQALWQKKVKHLKKEEAK
jgi:hypothetical protein